jgi:hypothetical protein
LIAGRALNEDDVPDVQDVDHDHEDRHDHGEAAYHLPRDQVAFVLKPRRRASTRHASNAVLSSRLRGVAFLELHSATLHRPI